MGSGFDATSELSRSHGFCRCPYKNHKALERPSPPGRYYHIEGTDKKDPAAPSVGSSDLDRQGFDAKRALAGGQDKPWLSLLAGYIIFYLFRHAVGVFRILRLSKFVWQNLPFVCCIWGCCLESSAEFQMIAFQKLLRFSSDL